MTSVELDKCVVVTDANGSPMLNDNNLILRDPRGDVLFSLPLTAEIAHLFNLNIVCVESSEQGSVPPDQGESSAAVLAVPDDQASGSKSRPACWKDDNAVKALIGNWKSHQHLCESKLVRNNTVWFKIAEKLKAENPLWVYTEKQCEDKIKDLRKAFSKTIDPGTGSGRTTCKFFAELEDAMGDKASVMPVTLASSLVKRKSPDLPTSDFESGDSCSEETPKAKKKKSASEKNLERLRNIRAEEAKSQEAARAERHRERMLIQQQAIEAFKDTMNKLIEKL